MSHNRKANQLIMTKITDKIEWNRVLLTSNHNDDKIWEQHTHHFNTHKSKYKMRLFLQEKLNPNRVPGWFLYESWGMTKEKDRRYSLYIW